MYPNIESIDSANNILNISDSLIISESGLPQQLNLHFPPTEFSSVEFTMAESVSAQVSVYIDLPARRNFASIIYGDPNFDGEEYEAEPSI